MRQITEKSRRRPPPRILENLDLFTEEQRRLHETIRYFHSCVRPVFRSLGVKQDSDGTIYEAVQWQWVSEHFSVVRWNVDGRGFSWTDHKSAAGARRALRAVVPSGR